MGISETEVVCYLRDIFIRIRQHNFSLTYNEALYVFQCCFSGLSFYQVTEIIGRQA